MNRIRRMLPVIVLWPLAWGCNPPNGSAQQTHEPTRKDQQVESTKPADTKPDPKKVQATEPTESNMADRVNSYVKVRLSTDLSKLAEDERKMIPLLIEAAQQMDKIFWIEAYGDRQKLLSSISDPAMRQFAKINYGPWDRLGDNKPFVPGVGSKPAGANFYPQDMTKQLFDQYLTEHPEQAKALKSLYTMVRRDQDGNLQAIPYHEFFKEPTELAAKKLDEAALLAKDPGLKKHLQLRAKALKSLYTMVRRDQDGNLQAIPYHEFFKEPTELAAKKLEEAAALAKDPGLKKHLQLRAKALRTGEYQESDMAWLDMKDNGIDIVIGPIETYEDALFGQKAAHEAYVLVKDKEWSEKLAKFTKYLPSLQQDLPTDPKYKFEEPGTDSDLNAYDVIYYAGDCNAGAKTIAINLPNDEEVQLEKGTRRLQLKNVMRAKFDRILMPIAKELIAEDQLKHITFDAFFENTMFHEVAHGLGIKHTVTGKGTVREALKDLASAMEEGKADVVGLFIVERLRDDDVIKEGDIKDNYVTFLAGIFRSVRFGAASAHGRANMLRFNFFKHMGAFTRDSESGKYRVNFDMIPMAIEALSGTILLLQGEGNYDSVANLMGQLGKMDVELTADVGRLQAAGIPVDIVFEQGLAELK